MAFLARQVGVAAQEEVVYVFAFMRVQLIHTRATDALLIAGIQILHRGEGVTD